MKKKTIKETIGFFSFLFFNCKHNMTFSLLYDSIYAIAKEKLRIFSRPNFYLHIHKNHMYSTKILEKLIAADKYLNKWYSI